MIVLVRWPVFWWVMLLGVLLALLLAAIERVARTGLLGLAAMGLWGLLAVSALLWTLMENRRIFVITVLYLLGGFVVLDIGGPMTATGEPVKVAAGSGLIGLYFVPGLCVMAAVLPFSQVRLRAVVGGKKDYYRGLIHLTEGRREEALASLSRYHQQHPQDPCGWEWLARSLVGAHRYDEALEKADRALELKRTPEGLLNRGRILLILGAGEEALSDIEAALELKPRPPAGRRVLALALMSLRRADDALAALKRERFWCKNSLYFWVLGDVHRLYRRGDLAFKAYEEAAKWATRELKACLPSAKGVMAYALAEQAKLEQAEEVVRASLSKDPRTS